jgi:hypothetical protein
MNVIRTISCKVHTPSVTRAATVPPRVVGLRNKIRECDEAYKRDLLQAKIKHFKQAFPEIIQLADNENIRNAMLDCEELSWPRGNAFKDRAREMVPNAKVFVRRCISDILEKEDITDEVAAFLEAYLIEKKVIE